MFSSSYQAISLLLFLGKLLGRVAGRYLVSSRFLATVTHSVLALPHPPLTLFLARSPVNSMSTNLMTIFSLHLTDFKAAFNSVDNYPTLNMFSPWLLWHPSALPPTPLVILHSFCWFLHPQWSLCWRAPGLDLLAVFSSLLNHAREDP